MSTITSVEQALERTTAVGDCLVWHRGKTKAGYAQATIHQKVTLMHRWMYERLVGPIPDGLVIDHLCRNRACINIEHMEVVTRGENVLRGDTPSGRNSRKTECKYGHELTPLPSGKGRRCVTCHRAHAAMTYARKKGR